MNVIRPSVRKDEVKKESGEVEVKGGDEEVVDQDKVKPVNDASDGQAGAKGGHQRQPQEHGHQNRGQQRPASQKRQGNVPKSRMNTYGLNK